VKVPFHCAVHNTHSLTFAHVRTNIFPHHTCCLHCRETDELDRYTGEPYLLRVQCMDRQGRTLQIHCRLSEEYLNLRPGRPATTLLLSTSPKFTKLAALTDVYVLPPVVDDANFADDDDDDNRGVWIGDYPYLDRAEVEALLAEDDDLWDALQLEAEPIAEGDEG